MIRRLFAIACDICHGCGRLQELAAGSKWEAVVYESSGMGRVELARLWALTQCDYINNMPKHE